MLRILVLIHSCFTYCHFAHSLIDLREFEIVLPMLWHLLWGVVNVVRDLRLLVEALLDHLSLHAEP